MTWRVDNKPGRSDSDDACPHHCPPRGHVPMCQPTTAERRPPDDKRRSTSR
ncbi:hypothetical protein K443DRAFT_12355 [Laccaria amethystina LaAM-08-1]|uniref:Unplaced genomic scaffold K443scaffold_272, whole genome shotgun sequence n=1 Tax=Laccaria amethystina LaAM-08-1 TaxID=1095629 RepID=A0A0C9WJ64_9AGAR|nr:hypothetical protein K443DRAFT_12355 [Laccaria amethystina LaAM-08-1]